MKKLLTLMVAAFFGCPLFATTWYVNGTSGSDSYPGTSSSKAKKTIQAAIDVASDGDAILVSAGTYAPIQTHSKLIRIVSIEGAERTVIDGGQQSCCVDAEGRSTNSVVVGFTMTNGRDGIQGGIALRCIISHNVGVGCSHGIAENCLIVGNSAINGGGGQGAVLRNCTVSGNYASDNGGGSYGCVIENSIVCGNTSGCDWGNDGGNIFNLGWANDDWMETLLGYTDFVTDGYFSSSPKFVDVANGDYHLAAGSPCINAGDNSYVTSETDLDGNSRIVNGKVDIGCYERQGGQVSSQYTVTFNANGGSCSTSSKQYTSGATLGTLPTATRSRYAFDGWYTSSSGGSKVSSSTTVTGNVTYYAHWAQTVMRSVRASDIKYSDLGNGTHKYPVLIDPNGGEGEPILQFVMTSWSGEYDGVFTVPACPYTRAGYSFAGWKVYDACHMGTDRYAYFDGLDTCNIGAYVATYSANERFSICGITALVAQWIQVEGKNGLDDGLVAYYKFDGNAYDFSGNGNDGTMSGATLAADRNGNANKAYYFDGINDYMLAKASSSLQSIKGAMTISLWVNPDEEWGDVNRDNCWPMVTLGKLRDGVSAFQMFGMDDMVGFCNLDDDEYSGYLELSSCLECEEWQHLTLTYDGTQAVFYRNGQQIGCSTWPGFVAAATDGLFLGKEVYVKTHKGVAYDHDWCFGGGMDDVMIYNRALSAAEVKSLYDGDRPVGVKRALTAKPVIVCESSYTITPGKSCSIPIKVESTVKKTTVTVSKLPKGLSFKSGKITGKAAKPGTTKVKVVAKNSKGTTTKYVTIKAVNPGFNVTLAARPNGASASAAQPIEKSGDTVQVYVGVQQTITIASTPGVSGVSSSSAKVTVSGLPKGLTYKSGKISGVVRSTGSKTATVKFKNKWGWSKSFKIVIKAVALPSSVRGTFNGFVSADVSWLYAHQDLSESDDVEDSCEDCGYSDYSGYDEDDEYDDYDSYWTWHDSVLWLSTPRSYVHGKTYALKVSSGTTGKLSAKLGSTSFTASKWTSAVDGVFKATLTNKSKKLVVIVDTNVQWPEASMTVSYSPSSSVYPYQGYAVRNLFGKSSTGVYSNAQAGHYVKLLTKLGTTKVATRKTAYGYDLVCQGCMAVKPGYVFPLKVKVSSTGVATLTGKIGSKKISASAIIRIAPSGKALATYIVGGMAVDLLFDYVPAEAGYYDEWGDWINPRAECYSQPSGHATLIK